MNSINFIDLSQCSCSNFLKAFIIGECFNGVFLVSLSDPPLLLFLPSLLSLTLSTPLCDCDTFPLSLFHLPLSLSLSLSFSLSLSLFLLFIHLSSPPLCLHVCQCLSNSSARQLSSVVVTILYVDHNMLGHPFHTRWSGKHLEFVIYCVFLLLNALPTYTPHHLLIII